jgi:hypothetical protein
VDLTWTFTTSMGQKLTVRLDPHGVHLRHESYPDEATLCRIGTQCLFVLPHGITSELANELYEGSDSDLGFERFHEVANRTFSICLNPEARTAARRFLAGNPAAQALIEEVPDVTLAEAQQVAQAILDSTGLEPLFYVDLDVARALVVKRRV